MRREGTPSASKTSRASALMLIAIGAVILLLVGCGSESPSVGSEAILKASSGAQVVALADSIKSYDKWENAVVANDDWGLSELVAQGSVFVVPDRTRVLVIDTSWGEEEG